MGKLQEFLMSKKADTSVTSECHLPCFPHPVLIRSITEKENKAIIKSCETMRFDKKTHRRETDFDQNLYNTRLIVACCTDPNFKDAELQEYYGVRGAEDLVEYLLKSGDYSTLMTAILDLNGFMDEDINNLISEAKN